jgi:mannose-6-phosphate isomerase-like protein (cupin superfamily)
MEELNMKIEKINLESKLSQFTDQWSPKIIAQMNEYHFKLVKIQGKFVWHKHAETDEVFIVLKGSMYIDFRDKTINLEEGEMCVITKGLEHKPGAEEECQIMLVEPAGTPNTGEVGGERTADAVWI